MAKMSLKRVAAYTEGYGQQIAFGPGGERWVTVEPARFHLWEGEEVKETIPLPGGRGGTVHFSAKGERLYLSPFIFDLAEHKFVELPPLEPVLAEGLEEPPDRFGVNGSAWSGDGGDLAVYVEYHPARTTRRGPSYSGPRKRLLLLEGQTRAVKAVLWQDSGPTEYQTLAFGKQHLVAGGLPSRVWDRQSYEQVTELSPHKTNVRALSFSPDSSHLLSGDWDGLVVLWEVATWKPVAKWAAHKGGTAALAFHPHQPLVASAGDDSQVKLWDISGKPARSASLKLEGYGVGLAFHPKGERLVVADDEGNLIACEMIKSG